MCAEQTPPVSTESKQLLGRNQKIGLVMWALPLILTAGMAAVGIFEIGTAEALQSTFSTWTSWVTPYTLGGMGIVLGVAGGIKAAQALAAPKK